MFTDTREIYQDAEGNYKGFKRGIPLFYKIPPNLPFPKGGINPSLTKRGKGRFF
jgi:hypothetical protein